MLDFIHIANIILPICYLLSVILYFSYFKKDTDFLKQTKRILLAATIIAHILYLAARSVEFSHLPITNKYEIFTLLAFAIAASYFVVELISDVRGTGVFILVISLIFQLLSTIFIKDLVAVPEILKNRFLGIHVISALLGYSGFTMSAVYGLLYFILYKELKLNKFGLIFNRLPSLETLEKLSYYSVIIGFILLTVAMAVGIIWLPEAFPNFSYSDPKLVSTTLVWIIFGVGILTKSVGNWYGRKVIKFYLIGYAIAILSMLFANVFADSFHAFY